MGAQEEAAIRDMIALGERVHALRGGGPGGVEHTPAPGQQQQPAAAGSGSRGSQGGAGHTTSTFAAAAGLAGMPSGSLSKAPSLTAMLADSLRGSAGGGAAAAAAAAPGSARLGSFGSVVAAALAPLETPAAGVWASAGLASVTEAAEEGAPADEEAEQQQEGLLGSRRSTGAGAPGGGLSSLAGSRRASEQPGSISLLGSGQLPGSVASSKAGSRRASLGQHGLPSSQAAPSTGQPSASAGRYQTGSEGSSHTGSRPGSRAGSLQGQVQAASAAAAVAALLEAGGCSQAAAPRALAGLRAGPTLP